MALSRQDHPRRRGSQRPNWTEPSRAGDSRSGRGDVGSERPPPLSLLKGTAVLYLRLNEPLSNFVLVQI